MVVDNLFPVFALLLFGHLLKRIGITHDAFLMTADKLIYFVFFPLLLFWKIGGAASERIGDPGLYKAAICAVISIYILSSLYIKIFRVGAFQAGSFSQSCYRFNTYAEVTSSFKFTDGVRWEPVARHRLWVPDDAAPVLRHAVFGRPDLLQAPNPLPELFRDPPFPIRRPATN